MVLLAVTPAAKEAVDEYCRLKREAKKDAGEEADAKFEHISNARLGDPIDHNDLIEISGFLVREARQKDESAICKEWRLEPLLKGANIYKPPPPSKPEPTSEYKALMKRLRAEEERRQYERMLNPAPSQETFNQRFPNSGSAFNPATSIGQGAAVDEVDEVTYADVNRQMALIINVLVSIIACSVAIWIAARRWDVPQRLGLSMSGSGLVAAAEVAIYMGYIRRIKDAKDKEVKKVEKKEIVETWVLDGSTGAKAPSANENVRYRKGKHR